MISRTLRFCLFGMAALSLLSLQPASAAVSKNLRPEVDAAIEKVRPALVRIRVVSTDYSGGREVKGQGVGSGAIITEDGFIVTNHHVAGHGTRMFCTLWDREEVEAELIGTDALTDISVIKLKPEKPRKFKTVGFGDSSKVRVGDPVLAMGSPMALSQSITLGIISNIEMVMPRFFGRGGAFRLDGEDVGGLVRWFAHDAAIYGGNSGGPLVNLKGDIIGINEISFGLGGAIPGNLAKSVADEIMKTGKVRRSWLGVDVQPLFKTGKEDQGILVSGIMEGSPSEKAGLQAGDVMLKLAGKKLEVRYDEQMPEFMSLSTSLAIGKSVPVVIKRAGKEMTLNIVPAERTEMYPKEKELKQWGLTARNVSFILAKELKRENQDGAMVTSVRQGGPANEAKPPVSPGQIIVKVGETPIKNLDDLIEVTRKITDGKTEPVPTIVTFESRGARYLAVVKIGIQDVKDPGLEVTKAWLPVETQVISRDIAKQLGQPNLKGHYITRVYPDSTAKKAGLELGDFIIAFDGEKLTASGPEHDDELSTLVRQYDVGKKVEITLLRDKTEKKLTVELARSARLQREMKKYRNDDFEFSVRDVSFFDTAQQQWDSTQRGALVEEVKSGSWAELGSLYAGDLILEVNGQKTDNVEALRKVMEGIAAKKPNSVVMMVRRGIHTSYLELEPNWKN